MNDRTYAMFNSITVTGRVADLEEVTYKGQTWLAVTLYTELQDDAGATAVTFNTTNGMYSLYKKGYMPNGRMVTVTGHLASFKTAYLTDAGQPKLLKRPVIHLTQAQVFDGGFGPGPKRDEVVAPTTAVPVDKTPDLADAGFWSSDLTLTVGSFFISFTIEILQVCVMNLERFAGENEIFQKMNAQLQQNVRRMEAQNSKMASISERQRQRDMAAAYGKVIPFNEADFIS